MLKKIIVLVVIILLLGVGVFYWQNSQKDVKELNKSLSKGVAVVKSLIGNEYKVVNKIDGYEFKVPEEWKGLSEIIYTPERTEMGYTGTSVEFREKEGRSRSIGIDRFRAKGNIDLETWSKKFFDTLGLVGELIKDSVGKFEIVKVQESVHLMGDYIYYFQGDNIIYAITGGSEDSIREIILNGKWQ